MQIREHGLKNTTRKNMTPWLLLIVMLTSSVVRAQQPPTAETAPSKVDIFAGYSIWLPGATVICGVSANAALRTVLFDESAT